MDRPDLVHTNASYSSRLNFLIIEVKMNLDQHCVLLLQTYSTVLKKNKRNGGIGIQRKSCVWNAMN